jgi:hypothetical protein
MTLFVNIALVGNYTTPNTGVAVNGIMWPGQWKGQHVDLMPWFNGELASSNPCPDDCGQGVSVNWLDGGGPAALRQNLTSFEQGTNQLLVSTTTSDLPKTDVELPQLLRNAFTSVLWVLTQLRIRQLFRTL